ncbi:maleylpyruvate isomerase family mycothiol-dependent enzyme [Mycobacterium sp. 1164985.4]|uniref:maleylpyruvate isomerase family mycothiol-dependent enzyme n=1 Tax=Mycobacterium sp. 1164985.4 TaxID=1834069 RepID=UPI000801BFA8|nr:maleylpyruvate isomerase family mycothiol-dependent enzyme [Mycobacterium sp. 1164985.4]OBK75437.1 hypothetical protein A5650_17700 [Mycobacterium sp. 1164985.4]
MDRDEIHAAIAQERRDIADLIDSLDDSQLATESLCTGWDVKTVAAHLVVPLEGGVRGVFRTIILTWRRRNPARALDEMARLRAQSPATEIAASLRNLAEHQYWRPPPKITGRLVEILCHSGDIRIPLGLPFEPDPESTMVALKMLTGPFPYGFMPLRRLRGLSWQATDIDRRWGRGPAIRGRTADLLMAAVGRTATLDALNGPGLPLLRQRISR